MVFLSPFQHLSQSHLQSLSCGILCRIQCKRKMSRFIPYLQLQQPSVHSPQGSAPKLLTSCCQSPSKSGREFFWWALTCPAFMCPLNSQSNFCMAAPYPGIPLIVLFSFNHLPWPHSQATGYCPWICEKPNTGTFNQCSTLGSVLENSTQLSPWRDDPLLTALLLFQTMRDWLGGSAGVKDPLSPPLPYFLFPSQCFCEPWLFEQIPLLDTNLQDLTTYTILVTPNGCIFHSRFSSSLQIPT